MRNFAEVILAVLAAFLLNFLFAKISISLFLSINLLSLIVIYFAVEKGEVYGACLGAFCGLIQDSFSLGIYGVAGIAKTILGFLAGYVSGKINVTPVRRNFVFIFLLLCLELAVWALLYSFIFSERVNTGGGIIFFQPLISAVIGALAYRFIRNHHTRSKS